MVSSSGQSLNRPRTSSPEDPSIGKDYLDAALTEALRALHAAEAGGDTELEAQARYELALIYQERGDFAEGFHHLLAAHQDAKKREERLRIQNLELARVNEEMQFLHTQLEERNEVLQQISSEDPLTRLLNRRYLGLQLSSEVRRARRHSRPLCLIMCDIDHFKDINDSFFTHSVGDAVLRRIAAILRESIRITDIVGRYGGDEFTLILTDTDLQGGVALAERLREAAASCPWSLIAPGLSVTLSMGVAELGSGGDVQSLIAAADARLYDAKRAGRDRVVS
jgi:diguanylate cyclase (GGDEF)-like protein